LKIFEEGAAPSVEGHSPLLRPHSQWGGGHPSPHFTPHLPTGNGVWGGGCAPPQRGLPLSQKIFGFLISKW